MMRPHPTPPLRVRNQCIITAKTQLITGPQTTHRNIRSTHEKVKFAPKGTCPTVGDHKIHIEIRMAAVVTFAASIRLHIHMDAQVVSWMVSTAIIFNYSDVLQDP
jgi:hypothetical protein